MKSLVAGGRLAAVVVFLAFCATRPQDPEAPSVEGAPSVKLVQISSVPDVRVTSSSGLPMEFRLEIVNPFEHAVKLVSVEVESVGESGAYGMKRVRHAFDTTIPARSSGSIELRAWVYPLQADIRGDVDSPVMLRGSARFESEAGPMRRNFVGRGQ